MVYMVYIVLDNEMTLGGEPNVEVEDAMSLDTLISELEKDENSQHNSVQASTPKPSLQKESVFVRLANRIKVSFM